MANPPSSTTAEAGPLPGGTLLQNRYLVERLLGGGGMGMVYLAKDQRLSNRPCAIKEMVDHFIDPQQRIEANEYFAREADTLAQLKHPAIPAISDRFDHLNRHYLVMEYVEGRNLEEELAANGGPISEGLVIDVGRQLCDVLSYLHSFAPPIVYRDMKPSNVMLTSKGKVMLVDFGIARLFKTAGKGTMIGTLGFAPPEQYQGQVDPRSDIYSLGATLHYVISARDPEKFPPFSFPPVRDLRPDLSGNLAGAIDKALAYKVEDRPQNIHEFRDMMLYGRGLSAAHITSQRSGTADLSRAAQPVEDNYLGTRKRHSAVRRAFGIVTSMLVFGSVAFAATYVYSTPELQQRLGIKSFIDSLPWKHEELVSKARQHPLEFERMTLQLSTREGNPLSPPKANFTDTEIANARYLSWSATLKNELAGVEGRTQKVEARFYDPNGLQVAASSVDRFLGPQQKEADFSSVVLIPDLSDHPRGSYKIGLYAGDQMLAEQQFSISEDLAARARAAEDKVAKEAAAKAEEGRREEEQRKVAMIEERRAHPLELMTIHFRNTTKTGTALSDVAETFQASRLLFVGWEVNFKNRLYKLDTNQYRVDAAYIAPDGHPLGAVDDIKMVSDKADKVLFSGRVGNSAGGAFLPGTYVVNFYLNGQYFGQKKFKVVADSGVAGLPPDLSSGTSSAVASGFDTPALANGHIEGLEGKDTTAMEMRLRPQPNGFLHGELLIHEPGYDVTPINGFIRGDHFEFSATHGKEILYFEGERHSQKLSGSFHSEPSGSHGNWAARVD